MELDTFDFIINRIGEVSDNLFKTNREYALSKEKSISLIQNVNSILKSDKDIEITVGECMDFKELLEQEFLAKTIMEQELYKQGFLDCVKLLKTIGIVA